MRGKGREVLIFIIIILLIVRIFPLYVQSIVYMFVLGYFSLLIISYSKGFEIKFKKYTFGRFRKKI